MLFQPDVYVNSDSSTNYYACLQIIMVVDFDVTVQMVESGRVIRRILPTTLI